MNREEALASVRETAQDLVGQTLLTRAQSKPNEVVGVSEEGIRVRAKSSRVVSWEMVDSVVDALFERGEITGEELRRDRIPGGFRSAFIFTLLDRTSFAQAEVEKGKIRVRLAETPSPIILTQRRHELTYDDEEGVWYHYPKQYWKLVLPGSPFVYYEPEERNPAGEITGQVYFGAGVIGGIYPDAQREDHRYAEILDYQEFRNLVPLKDDTGKYVEARDGAPIVFRQAVRPLDKAVFEGMIKLGGLAKAPSGGAHGAAEDVISDYDRQFALSTPQAVKAYVNQIRRPTALSRALKERVGYRCQLCGVDGFTQKNGLPYAEAHHVVEVSKLEPGSLASSNVLVLCPTCHRKMHYAPVTLKRTRRGWRVIIDGRAVEARTIFVQRSAQ